MSTEFDREDFEFEFDSLADLLQWMEDQGVRSLSANRVKVGDFAVQVDDSGGLARAQIAHRDFKGNVEGDR